MYRVKQLQPIDPSTHNLAIYPFTPSLHPNESFKARTFRYLPSSIITCSDSLHLLQTSLDRLRTIAQNGSLKMMERSRLLTTYAVLAYMHFWTVLTGGRCSSCALLHCACWLTLEVYSNTPGRLFCFSIVDMTNSSFPDKQKQTSVSLSDLSTSRFISLPSAPHNMSPTPAHPTFKELLAFVWS